MLVGVEDPPELSKRTEEWQYRTFEVKWKRIGNGFAIAQCKSFLQRYRNPIVRVIIWRSVQRHGYGHRAFPRRPTLTYFESQKPSPPNVALQRSDPRRMEGLLDLVRHVFGSSSMMSNLILTFPTSDKRVSRQADLYLSVFSPEKVRFFAGFTATKTWLCTEYSASLRGPFEFLICRVRPNSTPVT